jgi:hypothetical protein
VVDGGTAPAENGVVVEVPDDAHVDVIWVKGGESTPPGADQRAHAEGPADVRDHPDCRGRVAHRHATEAEEDRRLALGRPRVEVGFDAGLAQHSAELSVQGQEAD